MARVCKTVPGYGTCCAAATQNLLGQPMKVGPAGKQRCARCDVIQRTGKHAQGRMGFRFRFVSNSVCGLGPGGCPALISGPANLGASAPIQAIPFGATGGNFIPFQQQQQLAPAF